jgi:hypothetical protein
MTEKFAKALNKQALKVFGDAINFKDLQHLCGDSDDEQLYSIWDETMKELVETSGKIIDITNKL